VEVRDRLAAWGRRPRAERLARLATTASELPARLATAPATVLTRRPAPDAWAPVEIVCHLRDLEESFHERLALILTTSDRDSRRRIPIAGPRSASICVRTHTTPRAPSRAAAPTR